MRTHQASPSEDRADSDGGWFAHPAEALSSALTDRLRERIAGVAGLSGPQAWIVYRDARGHLLAATQQRLNRVLLLELHAASMAGELGRGGEKERWSAFVDRAATPGFRTALAERYPTLLTRIDAAGRNLIEAVGTLAERFVADLPDLERRLGLDLDPDARPLGELTRLRLGAGDPHRGGHTVSRLEFTNGAVMYKPRPLEVDAALDAVLASLIPGPERIRTARTLVRDGYGWCAFVEHRYCADDAETERFYANLGRWLAVMRLIGGTDLHADNIVAHGAVPVVVDAETMLAADENASRSGSHSQSTSTGAECHQCRRRRIGASAPCRATHRNPAYASRSTLRDRCLRCRTPDRRAACSHRPDDRGRRHGQRTPGRRRGTHRRGTEPSEP